MFAIADTCSGLTAFSALKKCMTAVGGQPAPLVDSSRHLLLIGAGGLGLHAIGWAKLLTDAQVVVAEPDTAKHDAAREAGADIVVNTSGDDALELIRAATDGYGPHAVIDFVGAPATFNLGRTALRNGGTQVQVGLFGGDLSDIVDLFSDGNFNTWSPMHKHVMGNGVGTLDELNELFGHVRSGAKKDIPFETRPIEQANSAVADLRTGTIVGRCVLTHAPREPSL